MRWSVARGLVVWMVFSSVAVVVVLIPDDGQRVLSLSDGHGPSLQDLSGIVLLPLAWLAFLIPLMRSRRLLRRSRWLAALAVVGAMVVARSVATDSGTWWLLGAGLLLVAQLTAAAIVIRAESTSCD